MRMMIMTAAVAAAAFWGSAAAADEPKPSWTDGIDAAARSFEASVNAKLAAHGREPSFRMKTLSQADKDALSFDRNKEDPLAAFIAAYVKITAAK